MVVTAQDLKNGRIRCPILVGGAASAFYGE
jgi:hypothetical protein